MRRIAWVVALLALVGVFTAPEAVTRATADTRPNILFIITDDQPERTLSVMPKTERIFRDGGTRFTDFYDTTPLCCPSRGSFWNGEYAHNHGVLTNQDPAAEQRYPQSTAIQAYLRNAGYTTGIVGKYWNEWPLTTPPPNYDRYLTFEGSYWNSYYNLNGSVSRINGYTTDVLGDYAVRFLRGFEQNDTQPWFLYVAPHAPHKSYKPSTQYATAPVPSWNGDPAVFETDKSDKPRAVRWRSSTFADGDTVRTQQLRTLMSVDDMVGKIFDELAALGEADNTLAIFTSDNGYMWAEHGIIDKRFPYEQSVQIPFLMRWPGHVATGATDARLAANIDVEPTLLSAAAITPTHVIDGRSLFAATTRSRLLLEYFKSPDSSVPSWSGDLTPSSEYVEWYDTSGAITFREYYDLVNDPWQLTNRLHDGISSNDPNVSALHTALSADRTCAGTQCP